MAGRLRNSKSPLFHAGHRSSARARFDQRLALVAPDHPIDTRDALYTAVAARVLVADVHPKRLDDAILACIQELSR